MEKWSFSIGGHPDLALHRPAEQVISQRSPIPQVQPPLGSEQLLSSSSVQNDLNLAHEQLLEITAMMLYMITMLR